MSEHSQSERLNLLSFTGNVKILHMTWLAFFLCFFAWFSHAPLLMAIAESLALTPDQVKTLLILNVALTIPARMIIGMLTDKYGPRLTFSALLAIGSIPCFVFALADSFVQAAIARFFMGFIGAGFVIGIRMVSEWFPARHLGTAEGVYGGWGNFGSAAGAILLPSLALMFGGDSLGTEGWRYAIGLTGVIALLYSVVYYNSVTDTPKGSTYFKPKKIGAMEVTSSGDFFLLLFMKLPMYGALALLTWKLSPAEVGLLSPFWTYAIYSALAGLYLLELKKTWSINREIFTNPPAPIHRYKFKQVAILNLLYFATFGSELAVISIAPPHRPDCRYDRCLRQCGRGIFSDGADPGGLSDVFPGDRRHRGFQFYYFVADGRAGRPYGRGDAGRQCLPDRCRLSFSTSGIQQQKKVS